MKREVIHYVSATSQNRPSPESIVNLRCPLTTDDLVNPALLDHDEIAPSPTTGDDAAPERLPSLSLLDIVARKQDHQPPMGNTVVGQPPQRYEPVRNPCAVQVGTVPIDNNFRISRDTPKGSRLAQHLPTIQIRSTRHRRPCWSR